MIAIPLIRVLLATSWIFSLVAGDCSKSSAIETLDLKKLEGKWYEHASFGTVFSHGLDRCQVTNIKVGSDGKSFTMANDRIANIINHHIKSEWTVDINGDKPTGDVTLKFKLPLIGSISIPVKILGTDYDNYIIFHACYSFASIFNYNAGFILTKKRHYSAKEQESLYASIDEVLKKNSLSRSQFSLSNHKNCQDKSSSTSDSSTDSTSQTTSNTPSQSTETSASTPANTAEHTNDKQTTEQSATTSSDSETAAAATTASDSKTESAETTPSDSKTESAATTTSDSKTESAATSTSDSETAAASS